MTTFGKTFEKILKDTREALMILLFMGMSVDDVSEEEHNYFLYKLSDIDTIIKSIKEHNKD